MFVDEVLVLVDEKTLICTTLFTDRPGALTKLAAIRSMEQFKFKTAFK